MNFELFFQQRRSFPLTVCVPCFVRQQTSVFHKNFPFQLPSDLFIRSFPFGTLLAMQSQSCSVQALRETMKDEVRVRSCLFQRKCFISKNIILARILHKECISRVQLSYATLCEFHVSRAEKQHNEYPINYYRTATTVTAERGLCNVRFDCDAAVSRKSFSDIHEIQ